MIKMDKLAICRICLNANVSHRIPDTQLKEVYEKLTSLSFQNAMKPSLICHMCHAELYNAHRLMMKCLKAENMQTQMLNHLVANQDQSQQESIEIDGTEFTQLKCTAVQHIDIEPLPNIDERLLFTLKEDIVDIKMEVESEEGATIASEVKQEPQTNNIIVNQSKDNTDSVKSAVTPNHEVTPSMCSVKTEISTAWEDTTNENKHNEHDSVAKSEVKYNQCSDSFEIQCNEEYIVETLTANEINVRDSKKKLNSIISNKTLINSAVIKNCVENVTFSDREYDTDDFKQRKIPQNNNTDSTSSTKDSHLITQSENQKQFICNICRRIYSCKNELKRHVRTHTGERPYSCKICYKTFTLANSLKVHERIHTGERPYICKTCDKSFTQISHLKSHKITHTGERPYRCNICDKRFTRFTHLNRHKLIHTSKGIFSCKICDKIIRGVGRLKIHERIHTGEKPYTCKICDKSFTQISHLNSHEYTHTGDRPYRCNICDKGFTRFANLNRHKRIHTSDVVYSCKICDKTFKGEGHLKNHERIHTGEKPYICKICDKGFTRLGIFKTHMCNEKTTISHLKFTEVATLKIHEHTGDKSHTSKLCDKRFRQGSHLTFQAKISHLKYPEHIHTDKRSYKCEICDKIFTQLSNLKSHERKHTVERPYSCKICDKTFTAVDILKIHQRTHTGDRPYICKICNKRFRQISHLISHERTHTGERPYRCNVCDKRFTRVSILKIHARIHTGEKPSEL